MPGSQFALNASIGWNYEKFLIDCSGKPVKRYNSAFNPADAEGDVSRCLCIIVPSSLPIAMPAQICPRLWSKVSTAMHSRFCLNMQVRLVLAGKQPLPEVGTDTSLWHTRLKPLRSLLKTTSPVAASQSLCCIYTHCIKPPQECVMHPGRRVCKVENLL